MCRCTNTKFEWAIVQREFSELTIGTLQYTDQLLQLAPSTFIWKSFWCQAALLEAVTSIPQKLLIDILYNAAS